MSLSPGSDWTNARLVAECLKGNEQAWHVLVDRYKNLIYSIALRYGAPHQDAADIFQRVCLDLFNELPRIRDAEALQAWLIRVTTHKCYHWKRQQVSGESGWSEDEMAARSADAMVPPDLVAELEREQLVQEAIAQLPPRCREMIELLFFASPPLSYAQVARRLHLATGSIGFIRGRCLQRLRKILDGKGF
jgi:RNA polymerase sigma factor (sigma-70 family)